MKARCHGCHADVSVGPDRALRVTHTMECPYAKAPTRVYEIARVEKKPARGSRFSNQPTACARGHGHPSKVEARVCDRVYAEVLPGNRVFRGPRIPCFATAPDESDRAHVVQPDFVVADLEGQVVRVIDAKKGTRSRDWRRGKALLKTELGVPIEEIEA